jgi:hypothetical protein
MHLNVLMQQIISGIHNFCALRVHKEAVKCKLQERITIYI